MKSFIHAGFRVVLARAREKTRKNKIKNAWARARLRIGVGKSRGAKMLYPVPLSASPGGEEI
jgi:hypothetical protein